MSNDKISKQLRREKTYFRASGREHSNLKTWMRTKNRRLNGFPSEIWMPSKKEVIQSCNGLPSALYITYHQLRNRAKILIPSRLKVVGMRNWC